jgi:1,2-phenylacetyl-CoA epoxidase catalytic subunit
MLEVMLCLPRSAWGLVLQEMAKRIGTDALQKIIVRACDESDWHVPKGSNALFSREKKRKHSGDKSA